MAAVEAMMPHMYEIARCDGRSGAEAAGDDLDAPRLCAVHHARTSSTSSTGRCSSRSSRSCGRTGIQTLFYAEGQWCHHWDSFLELPEGSIIVHCDRDDVFEAKKKLGHKFAISGGVPNTLLSFGKPDEVRAFCKRLIDEVAVDGGYILDAGAIMQDDTSIENMRVMTDYMPRAWQLFADGGRAGAGPVRRGRSIRGWRSAGGPAGGSVVPWAEEKAELPEIVGDEALVRDTIGGIDAWAYAFLWHCVESF